MKMKGMNVISKQAALRLLLMLFQLLMLSSKAFLPYQITTAHC